MRGCGQDRLKFLPRIVNVDEWAAGGQLTSTEVALIRSYAGRPLMTKGYHRIFKVRDPGTTCCSLCLRNQYAFTTLSTQDCLGSLTTWTVGSDPFPLLMPLQGPGYIEIDMDTHAWVYLVLKAVNSFVPRLANVVFDNAFVLQGMPTTKLIHAASARLSCKSCRW